jgi:hypothetical protein
MALSLASVVKILLATQASFASVTGTVREEGSDAPLAGAVVELADLDRFEITDSEGRYSFDEVPAGPQHVTVHLVGYAPRTLHAIVPRQGTVEIHVTLRPEPIELRAIQVRVRVPVRGVDSEDIASTPDRGVTAAAVRHHPLLAEPDFFQAIGGGTVAIRPESPTGIHVRSGASDQTAYLLDGIPVFSPYHSAGTFSAWNPDALSRLSLSVTEPEAGFADALSGVVSAETRAPASSLRTQGSLSTTQARATLDGPLGWEGAGYLVSFRLAFPGFIIPPNERSYLRSETTDGLAKIESPLGGGRIGLLGYDSHNEIGAASAPEETDDTGVEDRPRNEFSWRSRSLGGEWSRPLGDAALRLRAWRASSDASAEWQDEEGNLEGLEATRRDVGVIATVEHAGADRTTLAGIQARHSRTSYLITEGSAESPVFDLSSRTPMAAAFVHHGRPIAPRTRIELGLVGILADERLHVDPRAQLQWEPTSALAISGTYARTRQLAQSLRNPESVVSNVFPVDAYVGAGDDGIPVAHGDQGILSVLYRPLAGLRLEAEIYARSMNDLALVAPRDADPYATTGFVAGSGRARGLALGAALSAARYAALASYGYQYVRLEYGDTLYTPDQGGAHLADAGVIFFPTVTSSISLGASGVFGRRTTAVGGFFEWEACNLLDRGCEFAGSPQARTEPLGSTTLPAYLRVDAGVRKHWHLMILGKDGLLTVFGTVTNVFGRENVLTVVTDPETGERSEITMRPRAPLVVGLDWQL